MWNVISAAQLDEYLREGRQIYLVDIREKEDFAQDHIWGAVNIPAEELPERLDELPTDQWIVLYCYHGPQSMRAARWLGQLGYHAADVYGGMQAYRGRY